MFKNGWQFDPDYRPYFKVKDQIIYFDEADEIRRSEYKSGISTRYIYSDFEFETLIYELNDSIYCEWVPLREDISIDVVYWPGPMDFKEKRGDWITLLNFQQGIAIPNNWDIPLDHVHFDGLFNTAGNTMPWIAQIKEQNGYIAICETPWDGGTTLEHGFYFIKSLGKMNYKRVVRYHFFEDDCHYVNICKYYRQVAQANGKLRTLKEKAMNNPKINDLLGSMVIHTGIKTNIKEESRLYNPDGQNFKLNSFDSRWDLIQSFKQDKLYIHLDGWAEPGYDNQHPDYYPPINGLKEFVDKVQEAGYLFCIHDQYRDYYLDAQTFNWDEAVQCEDGSHPTHANWAGGKQTYLCNSLAIHYVKRNFNRLKESGINLDAAYLDVFTCNEGDECFNLRHKISRKEAYQHRLNCFEYLESQQIISSSEEVNDWAMSSLVLCHYAPYDFMLREPGSPKFGIPVPLFNLVYHDCVMSPWMMEKHGWDDYFLYALLNGGMPYLVREGAYQNIDGAFDSENLEQQNHLQRCQVLAELHKKVGNLELVSHAYAGLIHESIFSDGTTVIVDFNTGNYQIT